MKKTHCTFRALCVFEGDTLLGPLNTEIHFRQLAPAMILTHGAASMGLYRECLQYKSGLLKLITHTDAVLKGTIEHKALMHI